MSSILERISTPDLEALQAGRLKDVSTVGLQLYQRYLNEQTGVGTLPVEAAPFQARAKAEMLGENAPAATFLAGVAAPVARMAPSLAAQVVAPGPAGHLLSQMGLSGAGEALGELVESPVTGETGPSPGKIAVATAMPAAFRAVGSTINSVRALPAAIQRTGQRLIPGQFQAAQEGAQEAVKGTVGQFADEAAGAGAAFNASRTAAARGAVLSAAPLKSMADDVAASALPEDKPVQELLGIVGKRLQPGDKISLGDLENLRRYLGKQTGAATAKEVKALQKGLYDTLESAAQANPHAADLKEALRLFKMGKGAEMLEGFLTKQGVVSQMPQAGPGAGPALSVPALIKQVDRNREELSALLGPAGMAKLDAMLQEIRTVPPKMAYNWANLGVQSLFSGVTTAIGAMSGLGPPGVGAAVGAVAGIGLKELAQNWVAVSRTPEAMKQFLNLLSLGSNAMLRAGRSPSLSPTAPASP